METTAKSKTKFKKFEDFDFALSKTHEWFNPNINI